MNFTSPDAVVAKYLLQVNIIHRPSRVGEITGSFNVWRKGGWFGHGDDLMKFCPQHGCQGVFDYIFMLTTEEEDRVDGEELVSRWPADIRARHENWHNELVTCSVCGVASPRFMLADSYGFRMSANKIAERMTQIFRRLDSDADIYLVRTKNDGMFKRAKSALHDEIKPDMGLYKGLLDKAREREQAFYPLKKIIRDSVSGNLSARFKAMVLA